MNEIEKCVGKLNENGYVCIGKKTFACIIIFFIIIIIVCAAGWGEETKMRNRDVKELEEKLEEKESTNPRTPSLREEESISSRFMIGAELDIENNTIELMNGAMLRASRDYYTLGRGKWSFRYDGEPYSVKVDERDSEATLVDEKSNSETFSIEKSGLKIKFY